jgi:copper resistance protein D
MSMVGVVCILVSGIIMSMRYIGDWQGLYGTAFGVMIGAKTATFMMLLGLGGMSFLLVERLRANPRLLLAGCAGSPRPSLASASLSFSPPTR